MQRAQQSKGGEKKRKKKKKKIIITYLAKCAVPRRAREEHPDLRVNIAARAAIPCV
jgi:hypothetical protein